MVADSSANAAWRRSLSGSSAGSAVRRQAPSGGKPAPAAIAQPPAAAIPAPCGSSPSTSSPATFSTAQPARTGTCPRRSTSRPSSGAVTPTASAFRPATSPPAANEPVSSRVRSTSTRPIAAPGTRPTIEAPNSHTKPGARSTAPSGTRGVATAAADMRPSLRAAAAGTKRFGQDRIRRYDPPVISYLFGPEDLARVRFAISPLFELAASRQVLRDPARHSIHSPWARVAAERVAGLDLALLDAAISEGPYLPDFVTPPPDRARPTLAGELRRVRALSHARIARELGVGLPRPAAAAGRADPAVSDPVAGLRRLTADMAAYWERAVAPWWDRLRAALEADIAYRGARLAAGGPVAAFGDLHQEVVWNEGVLEVRRPYEATVPLAGRGLLLLPAVFAWPRVWAMTDPPWQPTLVYPPRGVGLLWERPAEAGRRARRPARPAPRPAALRARRARRRRRSSPAASPPARRACPSTSASCAAPG